MPESLYTIPIGKGEVRREGDDITIVATSYMLTEAVRAADILEREGISAELVNLYSLKPMDTELLLKSVKKTGRVAVVDGGWKSCGVAAEVSATVAESNVFNSLEAPIKRICLPDAPAPACSVLENAYYRKAEDIVVEVKKLMEM